MFTKLVGLSNALQRNTGRSGNAEIKVLQTVQLVVDAIDRNGFVMEEMRKTGREREGRREEGR